MRQYKRAVILEGEESAGEGLAVALASLADQVEQRALKHEFPQVVPSELKSQEAQEAACFACAICQEDGGCEDSIFFDHEGIML